MSKNPVKPLPDVPLDLRMAFEQIDRTAGKIDKLKTQLNRENAKITRAREVVAEQLKLPKVDDVPDRFSYKREAPGPIRRKSGRFFLQFSNASDPDQLQKAKDAVTAVGGKIVDSGVGTAEDPKSAWLEVSVKLGSACHDKLHAVGSPSEANQEDQLITDHLDTLTKLQKAILVSPGDGKTLAKQLDLYFGDLRDKKASEPPASR